LLQSKIVVVAQRDEWEDHYRLYESLASGALVLTDPMLALPEGLVNGTNLLVYDTLQDLERLLTYYLKHDEERQEIAKRGFSMVMGRHRSWHRMEQILFGQPQTSVDKPYAEAPRKQERPEMKLIEYAADRKQKKNIVL
jgi:glycosyltransferase involved in cell wall biosynthesis